MNEVINSISMTKTMPKSDTILTMSIEILKAMDVKEGTKRDYTMRIPDFIAFIQDNEFNNNTFIEYKRYLQSKTQWGASTKNKYLVVARVFLKELNRQGYIPRDITSNIKSFKQNRGHKKDGVTNEEMQLIQNKIQGMDDTKDNIRLKMILALLSLQGLRQIEVTRLNIEDINFSSNTALIQSKGQEDKEVIYLHPEVSRAIKRYINMSSVKSGVLLPSTSNRNKGARMGTRALRGIVKEFLTSLGIDKSTHSFRHYFTTKLIEDYKGDLLQVKRYTRHKGIEMLEVYNDAVITKEDLPRYYKVFSKLKFI
jgi:integrase